MVILVNIHFLIFNDFWYVLAAILAPGLSGSPTPGLAVLAAVRTRSPRRGSPKKNQNNIFFLCVFEVKACAIVNSGVRGYGRVGYHHEVDTAFF